MPELPEVETVIRDLKKLEIIGQRIDDVRIFWPGSVHGAKPVYVRQHIAGGEIIGIRRRGKYIIFEFEGRPDALLHLRMSGRLHRVRATSPRQKHEHLVFTLNNGFDIRFHDPRKFGRFSVGKYAKGRLEKLGTEPLDAGLHTKDFEVLLRSRRRMLKPLLLDQTVIAGMGNIYVDESLWEARLHPQSLSADLTGGDAGRLLKAIRSVLKRAIRHAGTSLGEGIGNFSSPGRGRGRHQQALRVYGREGQACFRCGAKITRIKVAGRSTHICSDCQRARGH